ncbi:PH domain-like protein, partial [Anaeromyces robustus]
ENEEKNIDNKDKLDNKNSEENKEEEKEKDKEEKEPTTKKPKIDESTNTPKKKIFGTSSSNVSFSSFASYSKGSTFGNLSNNNTTFSSFGKSSSDSKDTFASLLKSEGTSFDKKKEESNDKNKQFKETDTKTGEEDEECIHSVRAKLYEDENNSWKERGIGLLKINRNKENKSKVRLVMRVEGILRVILNERLIPNMKFNIIQDKYISFAAISDSKTIKKYLIKCGTAMSANELYQALIKATPEEK